MAYLRRSFSPAMRAPIMVPLRKFRSSEMGRFVENPVMVFGAGFWVSGGETRRGSGTRLGTNGTGWDGSLLFGIGRGIELVEGLFSGRGVAGVFYRWAQ